jgi:hypothetical protein
VKVFKEIITSLKEWWSLVPEASLLASGGGGGFELNMAARAAGGDWIVAYLSGPSAVSLRLDAIPAGRQARAHWIDPRSGQRTPAGVFPAGGTRSFPSPRGWEDAFLLVEAE